MNAKRRIRMGIRSAVEIRIGIGLGFFPGRVIMESNINMNARIPAMDVLKMEETAKVIRERMSKGSAHPAVLSERMSASSNAPSRILRRIPRVMITPHKMAKKRMNADGAWFASAESPSCQGFIYG